MKIAYILASFPSRTETFILREINRLAASGAQVTVLAARPGRGSAPGDATIPAAYRPARLSGEAAGAIAYLFGRYPLSPFILPLLALKVAAECPREALTLLANIHTIGSFARRLDSRGIWDVHACFLSWPGCIGLALSSA